VLLVLLLVVLNTATESLKVNTCQRLSSTAAAITAAAAASTAE
jgi:hypothetical protein